MKKIKSFLKISLALCAGITLLVLTNMALGSVTYAAGPITVNTTADEFNTDSDCSLREAIHAANYDQVVDACPSGDEADTIQFSLGINPAIITLASQLEIRNDPLTISGPGAELLAISGDGAVRVFDVTSNVAVTLTGVTVQNGFTFGDGGGLRGSGPLTLIDAAFINNRAGDDGGAIDVTGQVVLSNSLILSNTAAGDGGGINIHPSLIAGLSEAQFEKKRTAYLADGLSLAEILLTVAGSDIEIMADSLPSCTVYDGKFENNRGGSFAGALHVNGALALTETQFISNSAVIYGGAVFAWGEAQLSGAQFISNTAGQQAGGLWAQSGVALVDTSFRGNAAQSGQAGGLYAGGSLGLTRTHFLDNQAGTRGGGLAHLGDKARVVNTLFARNRAPNQGGAMYLASRGNTVLLHNTIAAPTLPLNSAAVTISGTGSIFFVNNLFNGYAAGLEVLAGPVYEDYNLFNQTTPVSGSLTRSGHSLNGDANFVDPAGDDYHLLAGSWALNNGTTTSVNTDIDGDTRPGGGAIDIGFDETDHTTDAAIAKSVAVTPAPGAPITYTLIFSNAGETMLDGIVIADIIPALVEQITVISGGALITNTGAISDFVWRVAPLSPGQIAAITLTGILTEALPRGVFTNTVQLDVFRPPESTTANNTDAVSVTVPNFAPVAHIDVFTTAEETALTLYPLANDIDGDPLTIDTFSQPLFGASSRSGDAGLVYTPTLNFNGVDAFTYVVSDNEFTDTATISVTVTPVNDTPVITAEVLTITISEDSQPTPFALTVSGSDVDNNPLSWLLLAPPLHGPARVENGPAFNTTAAYTPTENYFGYDSFIIQVSDGVLTDAVAVSITLEAVNDAPVAGDDAILILNKKESSEMLPLTLGQAVTLTVLTNDTDIDSAPLTLGRVGAPDHGGSAGIAAGSNLLIYTPTATFTGTEIFTYTAFDGDRFDTASVTATVLSGINGGNNGDVFTVANRGECGVITITLEVPAGIAGGGKFALIYDEPAGQAYLPPGDLVPVCNLFNLTTYLNDLFVDDFAFQEPLTLTFDYGHTDVAAIGGLIEQNMALYRRDGAGWSAAGISVLQHDTTANRLRLTLNHASEFRFFRRVPVYLPLVMKNYMSAPDLVVQSLRATVDSVQVVIANSGTGPVIDEFWVDVYLNPYSPPTGVNQIWETSGNQGLAWGITAQALPLVQGLVLTLTVGDAYYRADKSAVTWPLADGLPVYAQVDSVNLNTSYGAVLEYHEIKQQAYNNIIAATSGPAVVGVVISADKRAVTSDRLPERGY